MLDIAKGRRLSPLVVAATRGVSMFVDESVVQSNIISLAVEIIFGVILIL